MNSYTDEYQDEPDIAFLSTGDWVVTWVSNVATSGFDIDIHGRAFHDSSPVTAEVTVNTVTTGNQMTPAISTSPDGYGYVIAWRNTGSTVSARRYGDTHTPLGNEFQATTTPGGTSVFDEPDVAMGSQGRFLVIAVAPDGDGKGIIAQQFNSDGTPSGPELILNQQTAADQDTPTVASNGDDKFLLSWRGPGTPATKILALEYTLQNIQEPELTVEDDSEIATDLAIDFGEFAPGDPAVSKHVTVTNDGNADLTVTSLSISGASAALFALSDASNFVLAPAESRTLTVTFDPTEAGSVTASFTFDHNDTNDLVSGDVDPQPLSLSLSANVVAPPALEVTVLPDSIAEDAGKDAAAVLVTRRNVGDVFQSLSVSLTSGDENEATVPETAIIPVGELSVVVFASAVEDYEDDGLQSVQITASAAGFAAGSDNLQVESVNHAPTLDPIGAQSVNEGGSLSIDLSAGDADPGDTLGFSVTGLPAFASLTDNGDRTGSIDVNPNFIQSGSYYDNAMFAGFSVSRRACPTLSGSRETVFPLHRRASPPTKR